MRAQNEPSSLTKQQNIKPIDPPPQAGLDSIRASDELHSIPIMYKYDARRLWISGSLRRTHRVFTAVGEPDEHLFLPRELYATRSLAWHTSSPH